MCQCGWKKKTIIDCVCEKHYAKNPSTSSCESGKDCEFGEHLEDWTCTKSLANDLVVIYDMIRL